MKTHALLRKHFDKKKRSSKGFSLRSVAKKLEVSPSFLSRVLSGEKAIPASLLVNLGPILDIDAEVFRSLRLAHGISDNQPQPQIKGRAKVDTKLANFSLANKKEFNVLTRWFYLPILDLVTLSNFDGTVAMIAKRLGISQLSAEVAVRELTHLGLLEYRDNKLRKTSDYIRFSSSSSKEEIRNFHTHMLEKAQHELRDATSQADFDKRLITSLTVGVSLAKLPEAKRRLTEALHQIASDLAAGEGEEVYLLAAQMFPLTKSRT